jgi:hypothetical protein
MKKNVGIFLILASFAFCAIGAILKIKHTSGADLFLGVGMVSLLLGICLLVYQSLNKKSV